MHFCHSCKHWLACSQAVTLITVFILRQFQIFSFIHRGYLLMKMVPYTGIFGKEQLNQLYLHRGQPSLVVSLSLAFHTHSSMAKIVHIRNHQCIFKINFIACFYIFWLIFLIVKPPCFQVSILITMIVNILSVYLLFCLLLTFLQVYSSCTCIYIQNIFQVQSHYEQQLVSVCYSE